VHEVRNSAGQAVARLVEDCATSRKVAGSISIGVTGVSHSHKPSGRTMALGSTQSLTEMGTYVPPSCAYCLEIWVPQPRGTFCAYNRLVQRLLYLT